MGRFTSVKYSVTGLLVVLYDYGIAFVRSAWFTGIGIAFPLGDEEFFEYVDLTGQPVRSRCHN